MTSNARDGESASARLRIVVTLATISAACMLFGCTSAMFGLDDDTVDAMDSSDSARDDTAIVEVAEAGFDGGAETEAAVDTASDVDVDAATVVKRVFVSSATYTGNLGGLAGADIKCQSLATAAGLSGVFKAWLSDATVSAASRLTHSTGKYVLVDGTSIASDWTSLTTGDLLHPLDMTETKGPAPIIDTLLACSSESGKPVVWSNSSKSGSVSSSSGNCAGWTSTAATSVSVGFANKVDKYWTEGCFSSGGGGICAKIAALYCFEQ